MKKQHILEKLEKRYKHTPDFSYLRLFQTIPVFIYDDLKRGFDFQLHIEDAIAIGPALSVFPNFKAYRTISGRFIAKAFPFNGGIHQGYLRGEMYLMDVKGVHVLDNYYKNGVEYNRIVNKFFLEDCKDGNLSYYKGFPWIYARVYVAHQDHWKDDKITLCNSRSYNIGNELLRGKNIYELSFFEREEKEMSLLEDHRFQYGGMLLGH